MPDEPTRRTLARDPIKGRSPLLVALFCYYVRWKVRRAFHALRVLRVASSALPSGRPVIVYSNHPSWWDPAIFFILQQKCFGRGRAGYGPMDTDALEQYGLFKRLGVFGINGTPRGAARFLEFATRVLEKPANVLWVTAEGHFTDARIRPLTLRPGLAHLARRNPNAVLIPLALEYGFWNESKPEVLVHFGQPIMADARLSVADWTTRLQDGLQKTMDVLAAASMTREPSRFAAVSRGAVGVGGPYDIWRRLRASVAGKRFDPSHEGREA